MNQSLSFNSFSISLNQPSQSNWFRYLDIRPWFFGNNFLFLNFSWLKLLWHILQGLATLAWRFFLFFFMYLTGIVSSFNNSPEIHHIYTRFKNLDREATNIRPICVTILKLSTSLSSLILSISFCSWCISLCNSMAFLLNPSVSISSCICKKKTVSCWKYPTIRILYLTTTGAQHLCLFLYGLRCFLMSLSNISKRLDVGG